jgi:tetratricopeptide (TPR) repeat protein
LLGNRKNRETFEQSKACFLRAIELDPNYAQAIAGLGFAHMFDYQNRWSNDPDSSLRLAERYAEQAIEKNPNEPLARVVAAVAATFGRDLDRAKSQIDVALSLNPNFAMAYNVLGGIRSYSGQPLEAIPMIERAMRLDPASHHQYLHFLGMAYLLAGKYETAAALLRQRIVLVPETDFSRGALASLSVISVRSTRPVASGANSRRSIQITRSASITAGYLSRRKRTCGGLLRVSRKPDCRLAGRRAFPNRQPNCGNGRSLEKVYPEIRYVRGHNPVFWMLWLDENHLDFWEHRMGRLSSARNRVGLPQPRSSNSRMTAMRVDCSSP